MLVLEVFAQTLAGLTGQLKLFEWWWVILGTLRKDNENADADVDQRKPRTTHAQYGQPRFRQVLPRRPELENPTFAVLWRTSVDVHLFL